jgi:hypothetical protein
MKAASTATRVTRPPTAQPASGGAQEAENVGPAVITDHDRGDSRTAGEQYLHDAFTRALRAGHLPGWRIYEQPHLNGDRPDFVLLHEEKGVVIIEVKDWNLDSPKSRQYAGNPVHQVARYRKNVLQLYSRRFLPLIEEFGDPAWGIVETAVYFHGTPREKAKAFVQETSSDTSFVRILDERHVTAIASGDLRQAGMTTPLWERSKFSRNGLLAEFVRDVENWMAPVDYTRDRHKPIPLTAEQRAQASPAAGIHRRLKGVAGSGKTVVLASRAAQLLLEGQRVLFLTYNITLLHYVRDLVKQQYEGRNTKALNDQLVIRHFHDFLQFVATNHGIELESVYRQKKERRDYLLETGWVQQVRQALDSIAATSINDDCRFDAILIDEGQDFSREWVELALRFLTERNEFVIAFDSVQNIYGRELVWLEAGGDVRNLGFRGSPASLKTSHRLPASMIRLSNLFARRFLARELDADQEPDQEGLFDKEVSHCLWDNVSSIDSGDLTERVLATAAVARSELKAHPNDICILVERQEVALPIIRALQREGMKVTHVFDDRVRPVEDDEYFYRRNQKWKFQPTDGRIKVCTLHSFKGWESPFLISVLDAPPACDDEKGFMQRASLIYVGLTRLKRRVDGKLSLFACVNADRRFDEMAAIIEEA